uniref:Uncharacterized protein n=1 Tax=Triticum urartu TaxID=4572 RepID=A0A8R7Q659_TRIUA
MQSYLPFYGCSSTTSQLVVAAYSCNVSWILRCLMMARNLFLHQPKHTMNIIV